MVRITSDTLNINTERQVKTLLHLSSTNNELHILLYYSYIQSCIRNSPGRIGQHYTGRQTLTVPQCIVIAVVFLFIRQLKCARCNHYISNNAVQQSIISADTEQHEEEVTCEALHSES